MPLRVQENYFAGITPWWADPGKQQSTHTCSRLLAQEAKRDSTKAKIKKTHGLRKKSLINEGKIKKQVMQRSPPPTNRLMHNHSLSSRYPRKHKTPKQCFLQLHQLYCWAWQYIVWNTPLANLSQLVWLWPFLISCLTSAYSLWS